MTSQTGEVNGNLIGNRIFGRDSDPYSSVIHAAVPFFASLCFLPSFPSNLPPRFLPSQCIILTSNPCAVLETKLEWNGTGTSDM
jgi:hypothetical protein